MVFALSIHAGYQCAHSGACCTAGWRIPVEPEKQATLGVAMIVPNEDGACLFFDSATRLCRVHRDRGEAAKPESCRHFPRVALIDDRGTHVTLSHFCPTAAALLFDEKPVAILDSPPAFESSDRYEGLDARDEWPPLVHRTLLFDSRSYAAWESFAVGVLAAARSPDDALARIATAAEQLRRWTPADGDMAAMVRRFAESEDSDPPALSRYDTIRTGARQIVVDAIPAALRPEIRRADVLAHSHVGPSPIAPERVRCRYLAAKAFASWTAYQGDDVRTLVGELVLADALVRDLASTSSLLEAIREADRLLVHLADHAALVRGIAAHHRSAR